MRLDKMNKFEVLEHYFGYQTFREGQEPIIDRLLSGGDAVGIMPTGAGKSICYQVPALMMEGITLVISPLISLMKDQVGALVQSGVSAAFINSTLTPRQSDLALYRASNGFYKIIYVAPERLTAPSFLDFAMNADVSMVIVDEAHCVSQWGQNFRPSYLKIAEFIQSLKKRPVAGAFTATATQKVRDDIVSLLGLQSPMVTATGFDRPNLYFEVVRPKDKFTALTSFLSLNRSKSGIIYCATRKLVEEVCDRLTEEGWSVGRYHAGMSDAERNSAQELFIRDERPLIVATNAFGMGIDKSNVSFVVHYNMPKNMESYYQEAGRAGRDGQPAECILLYSGRDVRINQFLIEKSFEENTELDETTAEALKSNELELLKQMTFYCNAKYCLRKFILKYFGEHPDFENCGNCSNCTQAHTDAEAKDVTTEAQKILSCIKRMNEAQNRWVIIDILRGTLNNRVELCGGNRQSTFGIMNTFSSREIDRIIESMISDKYIAEAPDGLLRWGNAARGVIYSGMRVTVREQTASDGTARKEDTVGRSADPELLARLRALRAKVASLKGVPPYIIFTEASLRDMAEKMPTNEAQFRSLYGVGSVKTEKFGRQFMDEIAQFMDEKGTTPQRVNPPAYPKKSRPGPRTRIAPPPVKPSISLSRDADGNYILPPGVDGGLFADLQTLRADLASDFCIQTQSLASADALAQLCADKPLTLEELRKMGILPPITVEYCGRDIVVAIRKHLSAQGEVLREPCDFESCPDEALLTQLKKLRDEIAKKVHTPRNRIISDPTLVRMSRVKPVTRFQLMERLHIGHSKCLVYGRIFLQAVRQYTGDESQPDGFEGAPQADEELFLRLAELRHEFARKAGKTDLTVMSDYTLFDICVKRPMNEEDFRTIYGIGEFKSRKYAAAFIEAVKEYTQKET